MRIGLVVGMAAALLAARGATQQFVQPVYPVEGWPRAIAVIDLDGEGRPDLATANYEVDSVSLLRARPQGGYEPALSWPAGNGPTALRVADMNLDGHDDLLVVDELGSQLTVLWLTDAGQTVTTSSYPQAGSTPLDLAVGDIDGDGDTDVLVADTKLNRVAVRLGLGPAGLGPVTTYAVGLRPVEVELTDLDGDGDLDFVTVNQDTRDVSVRINDGSGVFSSKPSFNVGSKPTGLAVGDYDGDGQVDLAVGMLAQPTIRLLLGDGTGGLQAEPSLTLPETPRALAVGELNGDGLPDLVATTTWPVGFCVFVSAGGGGFHPPVEHFSLVSLYCTALADLDDDGRTDVVVDRNPGVLLLAGDGQGGLAEPVISTVVPQIYSAKLADVNGDGMEDLLGQHPQGAVEARLADGTGGFGPKITSDVSGGTSLATEDFDGDGLLDVVIGSYDDLYVGLGDGAGAFLPAGTTPAPGIVMDSDAADMTGDGAADLVVASWDGFFGTERHTLWILPGDGTGQLAAARTGITYGTYSDADAANDILLLLDPDGDGDLDVALADGTASVVRVFVNDGAGSMAELGSTFVDGLEGDQDRQTLASGDLDGDGDLDLGVRTELGVSLMLGNGGGSFAAPTTIVSTDGFGRLHIKSADVDDDGDMDLVSDDDISHFLLLRNDGAGNFEEERHGSGTYPYELDLGRINGDGVPDVVYVAAGGKALVYLNLLLLAAWDDIGFGLAGSTGVPSLVGSGTLEAGSTGTLALSHAKPASLAMLFVSVQSIPTPFKGGVLATVPPLLSLTLFTSPAGAINLSWAHWPTAPSGLSWYFQYGIADPAGPAGVALSNALRATQP